LVAEVNLQVNESVEGYTIGSRSYLYRELLAKNPNMSRKQRDFRSTGILIKIEEPWFAGSSQQSREARERVSEGLMGLVSRDRSIAPHDIDSTYSNIALLTEMGPRRLTDAVVIYDSVYGGLRLTEELFTEFPRYIGQLGRAADLAGGDAVVSDKTTEFLKAWVQTLGDGEATTMSRLDAPNGFLQIYKPGSVVSILYNQNFVERELIEPKLIDPFGTGNNQLFYSYRNVRAIGYVPHDQVQPTSHEWSWTLWNPETNEFQELDEGIGIEPQEPQPPK
jgi:DEAD/DEAH box helicase domain-containing protein